MAAYYIMTNYGPMSITGLKKVSDDHIKEILKDAPQDMDTFSEISEKYQDLLKRVEKMESIEANQDLSNSVDELPAPSSDSLNQIYVDGNKNVFITVNTGTESAPNFEWITINKNDSLSAEDTEDTTTYDDIF